ncbi:hypothetical protein D3C86_1457310 [compost metagenome]
MPAPLPRGLGLGQDLVAGHRVGALHLAEILGRLGLDHEVGLVHLPVLPVDLELPLGGFEPLAHVHVVLEQDCELPFGIRVELLRLIAALLETLEDIAADVALGVYRLPYISRLAAVAREGTILEDLETLGYLRLVGGGGFLEVSPHLRVDGLGQGALLLIEHLQHLVVAQVGLEVRDELTGQLV